MEGNYERLEPELGPLCVHRTPDSINVWRATVYAHLYRMGFECLFIHIYLTEVEGVYTYLVGVNEEHYETGYEEHYSEHHAAFHLAVVAAEPYRPWYLHLSHFAFKAVTGQASRLNSIHITGCEEGRRRRRCGHHAG